MKNILAISVIASMTLEHTYGGFAYYKSATLAESQSGTADSTDWPLTIGLDGNVQAADLDLKTIGNGGYVQNASGYDIRPYSDNTCSTALTYELVYYQATTGILEMHVKIPTLSTSVDTVIYLCFGDSSLSSDGSSAATWDSYYKGVWHLPNGSTLLSTNSVTGTAGTIAGPVAAAGQIDGGASFDGVDDKITTSLTTFSPGVQTTWELWSSRTGVGANANAKLFELGGGGAFHTLGNSEGAVPKHYTLFVNGTSGQGVWDIAQPSSPTWHHIAVAYDGTSGGTPANNDPIIYVDGSAVAVTNTSRFTGSQLLGAGTVTLGNRGSDTARPFQGVLDEVSVSSGILRSPSWIAANYNSQKASSDFITWGAKTELAGVAPCPSPFCGIIQGY